MNTQNSEPAVVIRTEDPASPAAAQLIAEVSAELGPIYGGDGSAAFRPADVIVPGAAFFVAWLGHQAVGCGALRPMSQTGIAEIKRMYVQPQARGKGISRRILNALEDRAREYRYHAIWLETGIYQTQAIGLYESAGYRRIPCYGHYADNPLSLCYEKILQ